MTTLRYEPSLNTLTGGINATLLMLQLEYWFQRTEGKSFYKFLEPCEHMQCRPADSWCEEMGFTKAEFRNAFSKIGKVYKSKKAYLESQDKFEGHLYLSYYDRIKRLTYYIRNHALVEQHLQALCISTECTSRKSESESPLSVDYSTSLPSIKTTDKEDPCEVVMTLYHQTCIDLPRVESVSPTLRDQIIQFYHSIQADIQLLSRIFQKVHESDFLSGRIVGKSFRATLSWLMKGTKYLEILQDKYKSRKQKQRPKGKFQQIMSHNWDFGQLETLEQQYIEQSLEKSYNPHSPLMARLTAQLAAAS